MIAFLRAILSDETTKAALALGMMAATLVAVGIAGAQATLAACRERECERLRGENDRLRPLAEVTEVQTATARLLIDVARRERDGDAQTQGENGEAQRRIRRVRQLPISTYTEGRAGDGPRW